MDKHLKRFFKVKDEEEERWDELLKDIQKAENIETPEEGSRAFLKILKKSLGKKMRKFTIKRFRNYRERKNSD